MRYVIVPKYGDRGVLLPRLPEGVIDEIAACARAVYVGTRGDVVDVTVPEVHMICVTNQRADELDADPVEPDQPQTEANP